MTSKCTGSKNKRTCRHERGLFDLVEVKPVTDKQSLLRQDCWSAIIVTALAMLLFFALVQVLATQLTIWFLVFMFSVPPSILPIDNEMVLEGGNVTLTCSASGFPAPTVYWVKTSNGDRFNETELVFTNISRGEAGEYKCVASNPCNTTTELADVDVQCKLVAETSYNIILFLNENRNLVVKIVG